MSMSPQYLSTSQAAERLGLSREHVRRLIQRGELRADETVNGFMIEMREVERFAATRQVQRDQRDFRSAVNDLAAKVRHVEGAAALGSVVASLRDEARLRSALELSDAVTPQMEWINRQVVAEPALAILRERVKAVTVQWHRMADDADHVLRTSMDDDTYSKVTIASEANVLIQDEQIPNITRDAGKADRLGMGMATVARKYPGGAQKSDRQPRKEDVTMAGNVLVPSSAHNGEMARGFVVTEPREAQLEEKVDELGRKVEQLTELVMQQHADTATEMPTWQQWAGSDRPEDVLAKLAAIREEITGGKRAGENSTDVIRKAREARGRSE
jgi:excisionase family DNA binding protein